MHADADDDDDDGGNDDGDVVVDGVVDELQHVPVHVRTESMKGH